MYQRDYILRMIEMVARLIAGILGLIKKKKFEAAEEGMNDIYHNILREDAAFFCNIPEDKLTNTLLEQYNYTNGHLEILAELFNAEAELRLAKGDKNGCLEFSGKSLKLFEFVDLAQKTFSSERIAKMEFIRSRMKSIAAN